MSRKAASELDVEDKLAEVREQLAAARSAARAAGARLVEAEARYQAAEAVLNPNAGGDHRQPTREEYWRTAAQRVEVERSYAEARLAHEQAESAVRQLRTVERQLVAQRLDQELPRLVRDLDQALETCRAKNDAILQAIAQAQDEGLGYVNSPGWPEFLQATPTCGSRLDNWRERMRESGYLR